MSDDVEKSTPKGPINTSLQGKETHNIVKNSASPGNRRFCVLFYIKECKFSLYMFFSRINKVRAAN